MDDVAQEQIAQTPPPEAASGEVGAVPAVKKPGGWRSFLKTAALKTVSGALVLAGAAAGAAAVTLPLLPAIGAGLGAVALATGGSYGLVTDRVRQSINRKADFSWRFTKELFNDHTFWVKALAVKGGLSAIVISTLVAVSAVVNMPIVVGIGGIALAAGITVGSLYGITAGLMKAWDGLKDVYARTTGKAPKEHVYKERKDLIERLENTKLARKIASTRLAQKISGTYAWKTAKKLSRRGEDSLLGGIAVGGAALSLGLFIVALPVIAAGTLFSATAVIGISSLASAISGMYFSVTGIKEENRLKAEHKAKQQAEKKKFWNPGNLLHWGDAAKNAPIAPQVGDDMPFAPIGHPIVLPQPAEKPKVGDAQPLAGSFDPAAASNGATPPVTVTPPVTPVPKNPDGPRPSQ